MTNSGDGKGKQDIVGDGTELQPVENWVYVRMQRKKGQKRNNKRHRLQLNREKSRERETGGRENATSAPVTEM